ALGGVGTRTLAAARRAGRRDLEADRRRAQHRRDHRRSRPPLRGTARGDRRRRDGAASRPGRQGRARAMTAPVIEPPLALLAELSHRCPLRCPYCSNPLALERAGAELDTASWQRVLSEAAALGVLQVHFSGGEPLVRRDLAELVRFAARAGLYTNLITSGVLLDRA